MVFHFFFPGLTDGLGVDGELVAGFEIDEAGETTVGKLELGGIEDVEEVDAEAPVEVGVEGLKMARVPGKNRRGQRGCLFA